MLTNRHDAQPTIDIQRSPSFSLATALLLLGHNCPGTCPRSATERRADVWFLRLPDSATPTWTRTLVDVDFGGHPRADGLDRDLLNEINRCVHADHIRVRERSATDRLTHLAALSVRRSRAESQALRFG